MCVFVLNCHISIKFCIQPLFNFTLSISRARCFSISISILSLSLWPSVGVSLFVSLLYFLSIYSFFSSVHCYLCCSFFMSHTLRFWSNFPMSLPKIECYNFPSRCKSQNNVRVFTVACCCWLHPFILFRYFVVTVFFSSAQPTVTTAFRPVFIRSSTVSFVIILLFFDEILLFHRSLKTK